MKGTGMRKWLVVIGVVALLVVAICGALVVAAPRILQGAMNAMYGCEVVSSGVSDRFTESGEWVSGEYYVECADGRRIVTATEGPHDLDPFKTEISQ